MLKGIFAIHDVQVWNNLLFIEPAGFSFFSSSKIMSNILSLPYFFSVSQSKTSHPSESWIVMFFATIYRCTEMLKLGVDELQSFINIIVP